VQSQGDAYIRTTNTKLGVFRDVIIESDYNPLEAHQHTIKIPTGVRAGVGGWGTISRGMGHHKW
jgi:hypothetical protein